MAGCCAQLRCCGRQPSEVYATRRRLLVLLRLLLGILVLVIVAVADVVDSDRHPSAATFLIVTAHPLASARRWFSGPTGTRAPATTPPGVRPKWPVHTFSCPKGSRTPAPIARSPGARPERRLRNVRLIP